MSKPPASKITAQSEAASKDMKGNAGNVAKACGPMTLNIGVFFDGTGNNTSNTAAGDGGGSYANARSNVSLLTQLYKDGKAHDIINSCGTIGTRFASLYVEGIGTTAGWSDWWPKNVVGAATGMGLTGVEARVMSACLEVGRIITKLSNGVEPKEIIVDVFGFSRGAAAARYFVNCFRQGFIDYNALYLIPLKATVPQGRKLRFRFVGIFDTVAAIGSGTNEKHGSVNVHMSTAQADEIYHLTAKHEYRTNFRLNHNLPGGGGARELPGAHSDVGGGYRDRGDKTRVEASQSKVFYDLAAAKKEHARLTSKAAAERSAQTSFWVEDGWISPNEPTGGLVNTPGPIRTVVTRHGHFPVTQYMFTTGAMLDRPWVEVGLSRIPLRIMYDKAKACGAPFLAFPTGELYTIPAGLETLAGALCTGGAMPPPANIRKILRNYGHVSANLSLTSVGMSPQLGTGNQRKWIRTIYNNQSGKAK